MFDEIDGLRTRGHLIFPFSRQHHANLITSPYFVSSFDVSTRMSPWQKVTAAGRILYSRETARRLSALLNECQADVLHGHNIYGGLSFAVVSAAARRRVPVIMTLHDYKLVCPSYLMLSKGEVCRRCLHGNYFNCALRRCHKGSLAASAVNALEMHFARNSGLFRQIAYYICPSRFIRDVFLEGGFPEDKLIYLPNALYPEAFAPDFERRDFVLLAGRLSAEKGVKTLLRAWSGLNIPLRIAGTGPLEDECRQLAASMPQVTLEGHCGGEKLRELYRQAAMVVVPSEWYENAPMSILEAFAYGKPVIGSRIGGIPELITEGVDGELFTPGEAEELAAAVKRWWDDPDRLRRAGEAARRKIEEKFNFTSHLDQLEQLYRLAAAGGK